MASTAVVKSGSGKARKPLSAQFMATISMFKRINIPHLFQNTRPHRVSAMPYSTSATFPDASRPTDIALSVTYSPLCWCSLAMSHITSFFGSYQMTKAGNSGNCDHELCACLHANRCIQTAD